VYKPSASVRHAMLKLEPQQLARLAMVRVHSIRALLGVHR
jgi:hypothetical protein